MHKPIQTENVKGKSNLYRILTLNWFTKTLIIDIIAHLLIILFLYTAIAKFTDFDLFEEQLIESPILGPIAPFVAWTIPLLEILISLLLFFPRFRLKGLYASFILMVLFTTYVFVILNIDKELPCSCGGIVESLSWKGHLIFNSSFVLLSLIGIRLQRKQVYAES